LKTCLIFGATGWLGKSTIAYLNDKDIKLSLFSSTERQLVYRDKKYMIQSIEDFRNLKNNDFDYFLNYAFLTGDKVNHLNSDKYLDLSNTLIEDVSSFLNKNYIKNSLLTSSGAVYWEGTPKETIYTRQKIKQEECFLKDSEENKVKYSISRIFAVFSNYYNVDYEYAFSSFINQGLSGKDIEIKSHNKVLRSYLYFDYLLDYFFENNNNKIFDAWNVNLDLYDLAKIVSEIFDVGVNVNEEYFKSQHVDEYISEDKYFIEQTKEIKNIKKLIKEIIDFTELELNKIREIK